MSLVQEAALFDRTAGLNTGNRSAVGMARSAGAAVGRRCQVRDVLGDGVLRANGAGVVALASLGHGIVARVKVFAVFQMLGEVVGSRGKLAVEAEEPLLIRSERLEHEHRQQVSKCKSNQGHCSFRKWSLLAPNPLADEKAATG